MSPDTAWDVPVASPMETVPFAAGPSHPADALPFPCETFPGVWRSVNSAEAGVSVQIQDQQFTIHSPGNCSAFLERETPAGLTGIRCAIHPQSDQGSAWGPGLAVLWPAGGIRVNLRRDGRYGVDYRGASFYGGNLRADDWNYIGIRWERDEIVVETSYEVQLWALFGSYPRYSLQGPPTTLRIGKMSRHAHADDFASPGRQGVCHIRGVQLLGTQR